MHLLNFLDGNLEMISDALWVDMESPDTKKSVERLIRIHLPWVLEIP